MLNRQRGRVRAWQGLLAVVLPLVLLGCSDSAPPPSTGPSPADAPASEPETSGFLGDARKADADPSQLQILEKGEVVYADYEAAVNRALECMRKAGIDVLGPEVSDSSGIKVLTYSWSPTVPGLSGDQGTALGDDCLTRYSDFVESQWQLQPSSIEAKERYFDRFRAAVVACLREHGGTVDDNPTRDEAIAAANPVQDKTGVDCFESSGIGR